MAKLISARINLSKVDKAKLFKGERGTWLDLTISVNDEKDNYGNDASVQQSLSKEEREAGAKKVYLGNGVTIWDSNGAPREGTPPQENSAPPIDDDLPF
jgi:hypothetical protein